MLQRLGIREPRESAELLTVEEVASLLRVPVTWVYRHADSIGAIRVGKYLRFSWVKVREKLDPQRNDPIANHNART
jgi:excisionase family DNA binding protein